jgi:O-antigen/teichoic acid export membrane protein
VEVARYGAVYNIASIPMLLLGLLDTVWLPRFFAVADDNVLSRLLTDSRDALYKLLTPVVLALSLSTPLVLTVWLSAQYHPGGLFLVIVTISGSAFPMAGYIAANRVLLISGRTVPAGLCMVGAAAFNIVANLILVPIIGIEGSALSTLLAFVVLQGLVTHFANRIQHLRRPPFALLASCVIAAGLAAACTKMPSTGPVFVPLRVICGCCVSYVG